MARMCYDFVIVGGGSAGCALANRLSADPGNRVLVLEAGRPDHRWDIPVHMPAAFGLPVHSRLHDWIYYSEPEPHMHGRRMFHPRGKVLGGSSSINAMVFQRGNPADFDRWAAEPGLADWDYAHCLPYFRRLETAPDGTAEARGDAGPQRMERGPVTHPLFTALFDAAGQAGHPATADFNGPDPEGFGSFDRIVHRGRRMSAARAYLHPVSHRPNLEVRCRALVSSVLFEGTRVVGVRYLGSGGREHEVRAGEVVLCGGAINTPQVLQLSGVGNADELRPLGVPVVAHVPGVGENLQDHLAVHVQHSCTQPITLAPMRLRRNWPGIAWEWLVRRDGPGATNVLEGGGFLRSNDHVAYPDLMFVFAPIAMRFDPSIRVDEHGYETHMGHMALEARGHVKITSTDPRRHPALLCNYLSTEGDRRFWVDALRICREILGQPAFAPFDGGESFPGAGVQTDEQVIDWVARHAQTGLHPSCTAKMGLDDMAVLDPATLRVHGVDGLRVVDASAMPYVTNGGTYAPVMMMAEKAADLILGHAPLPPAAAPADTVASGSLRATVCP